MLWSILITIPIILIFALIVLRCITDWGCKSKISLKCLSISEDGGSDTPSSPKEWKTFLFSLSIRATVVLATVACIMINSDSPQSISECFEKLQLWDVNHYINLVDLGYMDHVEEGKHIFLVFYPGYVWLTRLLKIIIPNTAIAGVLLSTLCYAWGCCWVHKLAFERYGRCVANNAVFFLSAFPFSFFFGTVMTEGLFLLTTAAACYFAIKRKWIAYGIWGCLAALTRMTGVLVIIPALVELINSTKPLQAPIGKSLKSAGKKIIISLPWILMPIVGVLIYLILNYYVDGDPMAFVTHQQHWNQGFLWISEVLKYIAQYAGWKIHESIAWAVWIPELLLFTAFFIILVIATINKKIPSSLLAFAFAYLVINYSLSWLLSGGSYLSCGFVFFILLAKLTEKRPMMQTGLLITEAMFLGVYI